jgi:hypothetical protein
MSVGKTPLFQSRPRTWLIVVIVLVAAVLAVITPLILLHAGQGPAGTAPISGGTGPQTFSVRAGTVLTVKEQRGDISVYPSNTNMITVTPRKHGTVLAPDAQSVRILYSRTHTVQGNDQITVTTDPWFSNTDFYVTIPETTSTQITLGAGSIDVHAGHGLSASTGSGSIALENVQGPIHVQAESGDVTGDALMGSLTIATSSGSIRLHRVTGQVHARTVSGDVSANASALSGISLLQTQNGSVRFDGSLDPHGSYTMQTTNGDIDLTLPANAAFSLDAGTTSGTIQNAFDSSTSSTLPRAQLSLQTQNGSIVIMKSS